MGNTILAKGVNHILAKRDNSAWPKGAKLSGFSISHQFSFFCWGSLSKRTPSFIKCLIIWFIGVLSTLILQTIANLKPILRSFFNDDISILRNYSYLCSEMGFSY